MIANIICTIAILLMVGAAIRYIVKAKKNGAKCIGCPSSGCSKCNCSSKESK